MNERIDYVFCSPFTRVIQTAVDILDEIENAASDLYKKKGIPSIFVEPGFCKSLHTCQTIPGYLNTKELAYVFIRLSLKRV
jgi:hypothetical protein